MLPFGLVMAMLAGCAVLASSAVAMELLMFRRAECLWCATWDREIGAVYAETDGGRRAPVRFVELGRDAAPNVLLVPPIRYTPTFVPVELGREIGRISYPGEDSFWDMLERLTAVGSEQEKNVVATRSW